MGTTKHHQLRQAQHHLEDEIDQCIAEHPEEYKAWKEDGGYIDSEFFYNMRDYEMACTKAD